MNADGSHLTAIWRAPSGYAIFSPSWTPDLDGDASNGYQGAIAVQMRAEDYSFYSIELIDVGVVNGAPVALDVYRIVDSNDPGLPTVPDLVTGPEWSPDLHPATPGYQGKFTFQAGGGLNTIDVWHDTDPNTPGRVGFVRGTSSVPIPLPEPIDGDYYDTSVSHPSWSPDLDGDASNGYQGRLAYNRSYRFAPQTTGMRRMDFINVTVDANGVHYGSETNILIPEVLGGGGYIELEWSRDGSRIAYAADGLLTLTPSAGNLIEPIPGASDGRSPTWSMDNPDTPDIDETDRYLVFHNISGNSNNILRLDRMTGNVVTLASIKGALSRFPDWRPFVATLASNVAAVFPTTSADLAVDPQRRDYRPSLTTSPGQVVPIPSGPLSKDQSFLWFGWREAQALEAGNATGLKRFRACRRP